MFSYWVPTRLDHIIKKFHGEQGQEGECLLVLQFFLALFKFFYFFLISLKYQAGGTPRILLYALPQRQ